MFLDGVSVGIGLLFLSLLYLNPTDHKPSILVGGVVALLCWLLSGSVLLDVDGAPARLYIASIPGVFFLLLPMIFRYHQVLTAYGNQLPPFKRAHHLTPTVLATLLSFSIGLMPNEDFQTMFFGASNELSLWASINSAGFALLLVLWTVLSFFYLGKIIVDTKAYHQRLKMEFANHDGKRLDWLVRFAGVLVFTWIYGLAVLGLSSETSMPFISETALSLMVLTLIWMFSVQALHSKPAFYDSVPEPELKPEPEPEEVSEQKYTNSSIDEERLKRIAKKVERKVIEEQSYLNPDLDASTLAQQLGISVHYLSQVFSQEMNTTFYNYINDARIEAAKVELENSQRTVLEIALEVGFNSRSSFYNAFKKRTGMTPSKYKSANTAVN